MTSDVQNMAEAGGQSTESFDFQPVILAFCCNY